MGRDSTRFWIVSTKGRTFCREERKITFNRQGKLISIYMNSAYHPLRDLTGHVEGILIGAVDVTEQVLARNPTGGAGSKSARLS